MTPGPWEVVKASIFSSRYAIRQVGSDDEMYVDIADVWKSDEALADATLMAAAPELLAACKMALEAMCDNCPEMMGPCSYPGGEDCGAVVSLHEAIAKAEPGNKNG